MRESTRPDAELRRFHSELIRLIPTLPFATITSGGRAVPERTLDHHRDIQDGGVLQEALRRSGMGPVLLPERAAVRFSPGRVEAAVFDEFAWHEVPIVGHIAELGDR